LTGSFVESFGECFVGWFVGWFDGCFVGCFDGGFDEGFGACFDEGFDECFVVCSDEVGRFDAETVGNSVAISVESVAGTVVGAVDYLETGCRPFSRLLVRRSIDDFFTVVVLVGEKERDRVYIA